MVEGSAYISKSIDLFDILILYSCLLTPNYLSSSVEMSKSLKAYTTFVLANAYKSILNHAALYKCMSFQHYQQVVKAGSTSVAPFKLVKIIFEML